MYSEEKFLGVVVGCKREYRVVTMLVSLPDSEHVGEHFTIALSYCSEC